MYLFAPTPDPTPPFIGPVAPSPVAPPGAGVPAGEAMVHLMSPTEVAVLLLLALVVDYLSVGPNSIRDRLAFCLALPAIYEGFNGSPLDNWTVGLLARAIDAFKELGKGAYLAGAVTEVLIGAAVAILFIYTVGALMPDRFSKRLGRFAAIKFPTSAMHRINVKLWACAALLGMLCDLPGGFVGDVTRWSVETLNAIVSPFPRFLFGGM